MPFAAALSIQGQTDRALDEVCAEVQRRFFDKPDFAVLFFSPHHADKASTLAGTIRTRLNPRCLLGCVGESIIGNDREIEQRPALSLWVARWTRPVDLAPFSLALEQTADGRSLLGWPDALVGANPAQTAVLLLGDPYTFPADLFLAEMNAVHRGVRVLGGMASGMRGPGQTRLLLDDRCHEAGAVGVLLRGHFGLRSIVSQGCRPIGRALVITRGQKNVIQELGGRPVLTQLQEMWQEMTPAEQELFQEGPHLGMVINEYQGEFQRGDFLVRNILGLDQETGSLAINDRVRVGQTVQFHIRDAATADEDLHALLQLDMQAHERGPTGALVFSCNGRGTRLFPEPHHDARAVRGEVGEVPLAGFFAQGELGPIGNQNFIHGFTACVALFEE
jgi:small ligand-binding sensory domain FIST